MKSDLRFVSLRQLEFSLRVGRRTLAELASSPASHYRSRLLSSENGKIRRIDSPVARLKQVQRRIHSDILVPVVLPITMHGSIPGRSIITNAAPHVGDSCVVRIDLRDCFPRISYRDVFDVYRRVVTCSEGVASLLTKLTTFRGCLPQGAPTSPTLANLALFSLHDELVDITAAHGVSLTMYIDDITLSGERAREAITPVIDAICGRGHSVRSKKVNVQPSHGPQIVTGVQVNRKLAVTRARRDATRAAVISAASSPLDARLSRSAIGKVCFVESVSRTQARRIRGFAESKLTGT